MTIEEIKKYRETAMRTKRNLKRKKFDPISTSKAGLMGYCDIAVGLCNTILKMDKIILRLNKRILQQATKKKTVPK